MLRMWHHLPDGRDWNSLWPGWLGSFLTFRAFLIQYMRDVLLDKSWRGALTTTDAKDSLECFATDGSVLHDMHLGRILSTLQSVEGLKDRRSVLLVTTGRPKCVNNPGVWIIQVWLPTTLKLFAYDRTTPVRMSATNPTPTHLNHVGKQWWKAHNFCHNGR